MNDNADSAEKPLPWGFVRLWTDEEVIAAIEFLKQDIPEAWAEIEELERTTADLNGSEAKIMLIGALSNLHSGCSPREISNLIWQIRDFRRSSLDLE